jgi:hypothetical protein
MCLPTWPEYNSGDTHSFLAQTSPLWEFVDDNWPDVVIFPLSTVHDFPTFLSWDDPVVCPHNESLFLLKKRGCFVCHTVDRLILPQDNTHNDYGKTSPNQATNYLRDKLLSSSTCASPFLSKLTLSLAPNSTGLFTLPRTIGRT